MMIERKENATGMASLPATVTMRTFVDSRYDAQTLRDAINAALAPLGNPDYECPECCQGCGVERHMAIKTLQAALDGHFPAPLGDLLA